MTETTNLHLKKPGADDFYNVDDFNDNFDAIDAAIADKASSTHTHKTSEISDFPASLPANGGNAETVGGKAVSDLMILGMSYDDRAKITSGDLDDYTAAGAHVVPTATAAAAVKNSPWTNTGFFFDVYGRTTGYCVQIAMTWGGAIKIRFCSAGTWYDWNNINDGGAAATANYAGSLASTASNNCLRNLSSGSATPQTKDSSAAGYVPSGSWYGKHD